MAQVFMNHFLVHYLQSRLNYRGEHDMDTWRGSTDTPVTFQVIAEEWILKAKSWEGAFGIHRDSWLAKTRLVSRIYL